MSQPTDIGISQQGTISVAEFWQSVKASKERCDVFDHSKVKVIDGIIHYKIYAQDGSMIDMTCHDSFSNRSFVSWVQIHDRYTASKDDPS